MVLLDTCALVWWALSPKELSPRAAAKCREMERRGGKISSISIWEIGLKLKRGRWDIGVSVEDFYRRLKVTGVIEIVPVDAAIWLENLALNWDHRDPADRTIVATAKLLGLPIVTRDDRIARFYPETIW